MSFKSNEYQQITLDDRFNEVNEREQKTVLGSWAKGFSEIVFLNINEERFAPLYSSKSASRPNNPINVTISSLMLKELMGLSDNDLFESIVCDTRFQYALHTTSCKEQPVSDRTFSRFRERLYKHESETGEDLLKQEMESLAQIYAEFLGLDPSLKRMDSIMVASGSKKMSRLEILHACVHNMVNAVNSTGERQLITSDLEHYLDEDDCNRVIYHCKSDDVETKIQNIINDATGLVAELGEAYFELPQYQLLQRMLQEQSEESGDGSCKAKSNKSITPDSLQNPSDPDATYRSKAGKDPC